MAMYSEDGEWYEAKIDVISDDGVTVTYTQYGNQVLIFIYTG